MDNLTHLDGTFEIKAVTEDNNYYYFEGYGSTFGNEDLGGDVVVGGAFKKSLRKRKPKLLWQHDRNKPIGTIEEIKEDGNGLFLKASLPKFVSFSNDIGGLLKAGAVDSMSIGFTTKDFDIQKNVRHLKALDLYEVSVVTFPMNPEAVVTNVKMITAFKDYALADRGVAWDSSAAEKRVRTFTEAVEEPNSKYADCFMWYDAEDSANFTAYKLLYCDVMDGELKVIPRAIFAIAAVLQGARGGVDISQDDQEKIKGHVIKYYKKMDLEDPFKEKAISVEMVEFIETKKDYEKFLRDVLGFSRKAAVIWASRFKEGVQSESVSTELSDENVLKEQIQELKRILLKI